MKRDILAVESTQFEAAGMDATEARIVAAFSMIAEGVVIQDPEGRIEACNESAERILGLTAEQMVGRTSVDPRWRAIHEDGSPFPGKTHPAMVTLRTGQPLSNVIMGVHKPDGTLTWISINSRAILQEGKPRAVVTTFRDVTSQRAAEDALRTSEVRFAAFMSNLPAAAFVKDEAGRTLYANPYLQELLSFHDWEGKTTQRLIPGETGRRMEEDDRRALAHGPLKIQETVVDAQGAARTFETIKFPIQVAEQTRLLGGIAVDITERVQAEQALREHQETITAIVESSRDWIWAMDAHGRHTFSSPAVEGILGYRPEEIVGLGLELVHEDDRPRLEAVWIEAVASRRGWTNVQGRWRCKNGDYRYLESNAVPILGPGGVLLGFRGVDRDVTERIRAQEEREKLQLQLAQAQKMESIGRLAGGIAHDFNNLLTVITGYSQLLLAKLGAGDPLRPGLEEIQRAGERAAGLTRQLLAFSRKQVLQPRVLDLSRVVEDMQSMLRRLVGEDVEVRLALTAEGPLVHADPHQLEQVVMNLAVNARDAMPHGGRLLLETGCVERDENYAKLHPEARPGRYAMLAVSDTGVGMDEATRQRIFEPFFTTKEAGQGTGLGLAMVQGIVAQSGGYINVYSEPGRGTTFKVYLPVLAETAEDAGKPAGVSALGGQEAVLVVEDQAEVRDYAVAVLTEYGYQPIPAANAGEALSICEREGARIQLVLTDVVMPHTSGRELAARLVKVRPGVKVLFMSGYTDNVIVHHGVLDAGAHFIQKPLSPEELAAKVREVLGPPAATT